VVYKLNVDELKLIDAWN